MTPWKARGLGVGLLAGACVGLMDFASMLNAAPAFADDSDYTALVLGHAFLSQPDATYMQEVINTYVDNPTATGLPAYPVAGDPVSVYTPETDYDSGLTQGITDLDNAITAQLSANPADPDPNIVVAGYSMSTSVITQEMINLAHTAGGSPDVDGLKFVLAEDLQNPNGGYFTRFPDEFAATLPATPADTPYDTTIYTIEYSGASDFPQYYGNTFADLNAADGYVDLHPYLLTGWPAYFDPSTVSSAVLEQTSTPGNTDYYLIPTQDLPLLDGLRGMPGAPNAFADLIQPDMRVLVDLGYNWTGDADVTTPATLSNPDIDATAVNDYLSAGADQGVIAYLVDLNVLPQSDLTGLAHMYPYVPDVANLMTGALSDNNAAATDATTSLGLLTTDLADSTNPLAVEFGSSYLGMAADLATYFQSLASFF